MGSCEDRTPKQASGKFFFGKPAVGLNYIRALGSRIGRYAVAEPVWSDLVL